jgi:hypothetical protein
MVEVDRVFPVPATGLSHESNVNTFGSDPSGGQDLQRSDLVGMAEFEPAASCS